VSARFSVYWHWASFGLTGTQEDWHVKPTPAARDSAYSEIEHEDEVYSVRQLAARDSGADLVKSERTLPALVPIGGAGPAESARQVVLNEEEVPEEETADTLGLDEESKGEDRPLAVTASIFRSADEKNERKHKDVLPRPIQEKAFVQALKDSLEESIKESLKENDKPTQERQDCRPLARTPFVFQVSLRASRASIHPVIPDSILTPRSNLEARGLWRA